MIDFGVEVHWYDPWVNSDEAFEEYGIKTIDAPIPGFYNDIILVIAHDEFKFLGLMISVNTVQIIMFCMI